MLYQWFSSLSLSLYSDLDSNGGRMNPLKLVSALLVRGGVWLLELTAEIGSTCMVT